ncbi:MAG TPA: UDP-N-acetylmuramoyl-L-alanyl-D-glutamate--2,6-diaminopimelate ligase [Streptomyces sp.]|nr:UDP-N-acetylmuramoyl-L-alanyl-D-glutamate--2,6-diaminopimelate ligase [Streptomyces sp.]
MPQADQNSLSPSAGGRPPAASPPTTTDVTSGAPRPAHVRPVPLGDLARQLNTEAPAGTEDAAATGITHDSRAVRPGDVYAALPGARFHGADFASQAASLGAVAVLTDPAGTERSAGTGLPVLTVPDPRGRMGALAAAIYGEPGKDLLQIGITGTSGKTTTAYLVEGGLRKAAEKAGELTGLIGTVESRIGDDRLKSERTTPEATDLQALFSVMRERGVTSVAMEVSSHALVLGRVDGSVFDVAVFNNLSPEHLDFHPDMEDYFRAKRQLFTRRRSRAGVVNIDDEYGQRLLAESEVPVTTFSAEGHPDADWRAQDVEVGPLGSTFTALGPKDEVVRAASPIAGPFNVANALAASLIAYGLDVPIDTIAAGLASFESSFEDNPGRLNVHDAHGFRVILDYAHNPAGIAALGELIGALRPSHGSVIGCVSIPGDRRDPDILAVGAQAAALFDHVVFREKPDGRGRKPGEVLALLRQGALDSGCDPARIETIPPEREAIAACLNRARPGDLVILLPTDVEGAWAQVLDFKPSAPPRASAEFRAVGHG